VRIFLGVVFALTALYCGGCVIALRQLGADPPGNVLANMTTIAVVAGLASLICNVSYFSHRK